MTTREGKGPYLIIAAFWQDTDDTDAIAEAVNRKKFPEPAGWPRGAVVAFRREVARSPSFQRDLRRFDLDELNAQPGNMTASAPTTFDGTAGTDAEGRDSR